jgi:hypothetical protein
MKATKRLTGVCSECGGSIQFPAELIGTLATCPRCHKQTELRLASPPEGPPASRKAMVWTAVAVVLLLLGLIIPLAGLKHLEHLAARQKGRVAIVGTNGVVVPAGLQVSGIALQQTSSGSGAQVVGTVVNTSNRRRAGISVEFDLLDAKGKEVEVARVYRPVLEPGAKWEIRVAVAAGSGAVSARLAAVTEGG